jgi:membrane protein
MASLWQFGGLTPVALVRALVKKIGDDELSIRSASLSYYFLLALFPLFLFLLSLVGAMAGPNSQLQENIISSINRLAPGSAAELVRSVVLQTFKASSGIKLAAGILGALWAASGGMSAVVGSLNVVYGLRETRPWWKQKATVLGLTVGLSGLIIIALVLAVYGGKIGQTLAGHLGLGEVFRVTWKLLHWPVSLAAMFMAFSLVYYFAPNLKERKWFWITPGSTAGVLLWLIASLGFQLYLRFFNRYSATYGSLGAVVILMLWLYITGFAILLGGEINSIIESHDKKRAEFEEKMRSIRRDTLAA